MQQANGSSNAQHDGSSDLIGQPVSNTTSLVRCVCGFVLMLHTASPREISALFPGRRRRQAGWSDHQQSQNMVWSLRKGPCW